MHIEKKHITVEDLSSDLIHEAVMIGLVNEHAAWVNAAMFDTSFEEQAVKAINEKMDDVFSFLELLPLKFWA